MQPTFGQIISRARDLYLGPSQTVFPDSLMLKAAKAAMREEWSAQLAAPIGLLADATVSTAEDATCEIQGEMIPRPENARRWGTQPEPLAKMAERARDAEANASGISVEVTT